MTPQEKYIVRKQVTESHHRMGLWVMITTVTFFTIAAVYPDARRVALTGGFIALAMVILLWSSFHKALNEIFVMAEPLIIGMDDLRALKKMGYVRPPDWHNPEPLKNNSYLLVRDNLRLSGDTVYCCVDGDPQHDLATVLKRIMADPFESRDKWTAFLYKVEAGNYATEEKPVFYIFRNKVDAVAFRMKYH